MVSRRALARPPQPPIRSRRRSTWRCWRPAAQLLGLGEHLLDASVAYVKQRRQFGREIGSYQAIKHRLADVRIALDFARPLVFGAALGEVPASAAKVACGDAAYLAARTALQVHGAVGYTRELDLSLWITKVRALVTAWGTPAFHRAPGPGGSRLMEVALTEDQQELASTLRSLLAKQAGQRRRPRRDGERVAGTTRRSGRR